MIRRVLRPSSIVHQALGNVRRQRAVILECLNPGSIFGIFKNWALACARVTMMLCFMVGLAWSENSNVGTSGAQFLKLGAGARPTAMGSSFVGVADDVNAVYFNPSGIAYIERPQFTALHTQYFQDANYNFGAFVYPTQMGAFAISAQTLQIDDLSRRGLDESDLGKFDSSDGAYTLSFARNISATWATGISLRLLDQEIGSDSASSYSGDVGIMKKMKKYPASFGLAVKNVGSDIEFKNESDPQPLTYDAGFGAKVLSEKLMVTGNAYKPNDNDVQFGVGTEFDQPIGKDLNIAMRGGYNTLGTDADGTTGVTLGGGIRIRRMNIDFAWVPFGDLGNTIRYSLLFQF